MYGIRLKREIASSHRNKKPNTKAAISFAVRFFSTARKLKRKNNSIPDTANNNPRMKVMVGNNINNGNKIIPMEMGPESKDQMS